MGVTKSSSFEVSFLIFSFSQEFTSKNFYSLGYNYFILLVVASTCDHVYNVAPRRQPCLASQT